MAKKNTKIYCAGTAKATDHRLDIQSCLDLYRKFGPYTSPRYQREYDHSKAAQILAYMIYLVTEFDVNHLPALGSIIIRQGTITILCTITGTIEIVDGQHRLACIVEILDGNVEVPETTTNRDVEKICNDWAGKTFKQLPTEIKNAIMKLCYNVTNLDCDERVARTIFNAVNETKTIKTNDKMRSNYCDTPLYQEIEKIKAHDIRGTKMGLEAFKNTVYRLISCDMGLSDGTTNYRPAELNQKVLIESLSWKDTKSKTKEQKAADVVAKAKNEVIEAFSNCCPGRKDFFHVRQALLMFAHGLPKKTRTKIFNHISTDSNNFANDMMIELATVTSPIGSTYYDMKITTKAQDALKTVLHNKGVI